MSAPGIVRFHFQQPVRQLQARKQLKDFLIQLIRDEGKLLESLDYIFCSDESLLDINRKFLQHDDYTDIITFELSESNLIKGEIYISTDRVKENSQSFNTSFPEELHRVIFHGALHLCGYSDKKNEEKKQMRQKEDHYLRLYLK